METHKAHDTTTIPGGRRFAVEEAAQFLGVAKRTLINGHQSGRVNVPRYKVGGRVVYLERDLEQVLAEARVEQ